MSHAPRFRRAKTLAWLLPALFLATGCAQGVDTTYGKSRVPSINGTGTLAEMLRSTGHEVRTAVRLTDELSEWAEVVVRVAPAPGPIPKDEAKWYSDWLNSENGRRLVYVPHDYDAGVEYWTRALEQLPKDAPEWTRERVREEIEESRKWDDNLPEPAEDPAPPDDWFATKRPGPDKPGSTPKPAPKPAAAAKKTEKAKRKGIGMFSSAPKIPAKVCKALGGPWGVGVDGGKAAIPVREVLKVDSEEVLLTGDGDALAMSWTRFNDSRVLVLANGSFVLNAAVAANPARWPLTRRVVDWAGYTGEEDEGEAGETTVKNVAFVEGAFVLSGDAKQPSIFDLLLIHPFGLVAGQIAALGFMACLALAPRLGRPRAAEPSGVERPAAHPEALGELLSRTGQASEARFALEQYRRWRLGPNARAPQRPARRRDRPRPPERPGCPCKRPVQAV
ncbi:MAG: hypothetical protein U0835_04635 [Isosphaeraceae bacterium]